MKVLDLNHHSLCGRLYRPDSRGRRPAILLLSGSEGGIPGTNAIPELFIRYLVGEGFVVLGLGYFGLEKLPSTLERIPLEYFEQAVLWLKNREEVDPSRIAILGQSRGAELALLLGATFPDLMQAIVACAPCSMVCGGFPHPSLPAWTYRREPIQPFLGAVHAKNADWTESMDLAAVLGRASTKEDPYYVAELFLQRNQLPERKQAQIPVEKLRCPLLLLSGKEDAIWPSFFYCKQIEERLAECSSSIVREHIAFEGTGHGILAGYDGSIYHPVGGFWCYLGGTKEGNEKAYSQSWVSIITFLKKALLSCAK